MQSTIELTSRETTGDGPFMRARVILAIMATLLITGCQQKRDANVAADHNKPAAEQKDTVSPQKHDANVAVDPNKPAAEVSDTVLPQKPEANVAIAHDKPTTRTGDSAHVEKTADAADSLPTGEHIFASCARCHKADGLGVAGKQPPLDGNPVVNGRADNLARIVLSGLHGPIEVTGKPFDKKMPSWSRFDDRSLAAVLTYIRESWSNHSPAVSEELVAAVRKATNERKEAWTMTELESAPLIEVAK